MSQNGFEDAELQVLDASESEESIVQSIMDYEAMLETQAQATIMGKAVLEKQLDLRTDPQKHTWLQDLQKKFISATGVCIPLTFMAKHFVRGMADGFRGVSLSEDKAEAFVKQAADLVVDAFDHT